MDLSRQLDRYDERPVRLRRWRAGGLLENLLFIAAAVLSLLLAAVILRKGVSRLGDVAYLVVFYLVLAYLALPRIHRILTTLYVPGYFIGRTRTSDGLLGDPVNLALLGEEDQIRQAMEQAGWVEADPVNLGSAVRIVASSILRRSYREAPVSPLLLFGRQQEIAYQQEVAGNPSQRHHVRLWRCPPGWLLPGGRRVEWLAAGTYDRSVGLSLFTFQVTHKIDADIDQERDHIVETLRRDVPETSVSVIENFSTGYHSRNGGGDTVRTDGALPIVDLRWVSVSPEVEQEEAAQLPVLEDIGRRPLSVVIAFLIILGKIVAQVVVAVAAADQIISARSGGEASSRPAAITVFVALLVVSSLAMVAFAWLVFQGVNPARLVLLVLVATSLMAELGHALVHEMPSGFALVRMMADVIVVYALTSLSARQWTMHRVNTRRVRRRNGRG